MQCLLLVVLVPEACDPFNSQDSRARNRGFGGHPAPEFGSTGENLHLGSRTNGPMDDAEVVALFDAKVFMKYSI